MRRVLIVAVSTTLLLLVAMLIASSLSSKATKTKYFSIELPPHWSIKQSTPSPDEAGDLEFEVLSPKSKSVFVVVAATDAPRFISCFCAPWEKYHQYEKGGIKYAELKMTIMKHEVRTLKATGIKYGTDVHVSYDEYDKATLDKIVESVRPF